MRKPRNCENCGVLMKPKADRHLGKFCSRNCSTQKRYGKKRCRYCGVELSGRRTSFCSDKCFYTLRSQRIKRNRWAKREKLINELGGKCRKCGNPDHRVLEFNHIDPKLKIRDKTHRWEYKKIQNYRKEKKNLELLCANCHRVVTLETIWNRERKDYEYNS